MWSVAATSDRAELILNWLIRLRWSAVLAQLAILELARRFLGTPLPVGRLLALVAALALSNALLVWARDKVEPHRLCGAALTFDVVQLSLLLHSSGGAHNPFSVIYLVYITLAAVVLGPRWTGFLAALSIGCYALLFASHTPLPYLEHRSPEMTLHLRGMWIAFTAAAALIAYLVVKLSAALEQRDIAMTAMRERAARQERIASVATVAAGAAHEMGTPLATIAVAAKELEDRLRESTPRRDSLVEDAALIRSELERCRAILQRLAADSGQASGEVPVEMRLEALAGAVIEALPAAYGKRLRVVTEDDLLPVEVPRAALLRVARNLLTNAFQAGDGEVTLTVRSDVDGLRLSVRDQGAGMTPEQLARVGEPFYSGRAPGEGLGLGVFIARTLTEQMGGRLSMDSRPGEGTTASVELPGVGRRAGEHDGH